MTFEQALTSLKHRSPLRITISGDIGSGKSTFAKRLAETLDIPRIYIGQLMREEAAKRGMTLDIFNELLESDDSVDRAMDALQKQKSKELTRGIFEGRTSWHFVEQPDAKLFFAVDPQVSAARVWNDSSELRDKFPTIEALTQANELRKKSEEKRYSRYYGISAYDSTNFDLVIDTTDLSIQEVFETAVIQLANFLKTRDRKLDEIKKTS